MTMHNDSLINHLPNHRKYYTIFNNLVHKEQKNTNSRYSESWCLRCEYLTISLVPEWFSQCPLGETLPPALSPSVVFSTAYN